MPTRLSALEKLRFDAEIVPHLDVLYRMARSTCCDADVAADIAQEAFLKALKGFKGFAPGTNGRSWLVRIVHNTCRDHWRDEGRRTRFGWDDGMEAETEALMVAADWQPDVIREAFDDDIENALRELPPRWRASIQLVDIEGWSYEEAAASLEIAPGSLRSALHRARRKLHDTLVALRPDLQQKEGGSA